MDACRNYLWLSCLCAVAFASGCNRNPYPNNPYAAIPPINPGQINPNLPGAPGMMMPGYVPPQVAQYQQQTRQLEEMNRALTTQLAQAQQQGQINRDRADLLAKQLQDATVQNQQIQLALRQYESQAQGLQASINKRGGAKLTANNSVAMPPNSPVGVAPNNSYAPQPNYAPQPSFAPQPNYQSQPTYPNQSNAYVAQPMNSLAAAPSTLQIQGTTVLREGNLLRIRIPADQMFAQGSAQIQPYGSTVLDGVANAIGSQFPRQRVGIEGHTDNGQMMGNAFSSPYQLSGAQSQAVADQLVRRRLPKNQLIVDGKGPNFPIGDNQTAAGRADNRRIEIVIYPENY